MAEWLIWVLLFVIVIQLQAILNWLRVIYHKCPACGKYRHSKKPDPICPGCYLGDLEE